MKTQKLYVVNYCETITLEDHEAIKTHSVEKAIQFAKHLKDKNNVLYSQIAVYEYNTILKVYEFIKLDNYYKKY